MRFLKATLWIAAVFNFVAAYILAFPASELGSFFSLPSGTPVLYLALSSGFVVLFGCAYAWMALQSVIKPLLLFGACGKGSAFLLVATLWMFGQSSNEILALASGDAIFSTLWFLWLSRSKDNNDT